MTQSFNVPLDGLGMSMRDMFELANRLNAADPTRKYAVVTTSVGGYYQQALNPFQAMLPMEMKQ